MAWLRRGGDEAGDTDQSPEKEEGSSVSDSYPAASSTMIVPNARYGA